MGTRPAGSVFGKISFYREMWVTRRAGGRHFAKRRSDSPASLPRLQSSGTDPSASIGYCCPLCPLGRLPVATDRCCHDVAKLR